MEQPNKNFKTYIWFACWGIIIFYLMAVFLVISRTAVDIPFMDGWELFGPNGIQNKFNLNFFFIGQNEHRVLGTKILIFLNYYIFGLNFSYQIIFNYLIFLFFLFFSWRYFGKSFPSERSFFSLIAFLPLMTNLPSEIHTWAFPVHFCISILAFVLGTYLLFFQKFLYQLIIGTILWAFSIYNFSGMIPAIFICLIILFLRAILLGEKKNIFKALFPLLFIGIVLIIWSQGYQKNPGHPQYTFPWTWKFWEFYAELISLGFGYTKTNLLISFSTLFLVLSAVAISFFKILKMRVKTTYPWFILSFTIGLLGLVALIAFGRAGYPLNFAKSSRYSIFAVFFPLLSIGLFKLWPKIKDIGCILICLFLIPGIIDNFDLSIYQAIYTQRILGKKCVLKLLNSKNDNPGGICRQLYPGTLNEKLEIAKKLKINFTQPQ